MWDNLKKLWLKPLKQYRQLTGGKDTPTLNFGKIQRLSDRYNPFDAQYKRPDGQTNIYNSFRKVDLRPKKGSAIDRYVTPSVSKVPGFVADLRPDQMPKFNPLNMNPTTAPTEIMKDLLGTSKSGRDIKRGFNQFFASAPQWGGELLREQIENRKATSFNPLKVMYPMMPDVGPRISMMPKEREQKFINLSNQAIDNMKMANAQWMDKKGMNKQESRNDLAKQLGSGVGSMGTAAGLTYLTKSTMPATIAFGGMAKGNTYGEARRAGVDPKLASVISTGAGVTEAALEKIGLDIFFNKFNFGGGRIGSFVANSVIKSISEGMQEGLQELGGNVWAKVGYDQKRNLMANVADSAFMGGLLGMAGGGSASEVDIKQEVYTKAREAGFDKKTAKSLAGAIYNSVTKAAEYIKNHPAGATIKNVGDDNQPTANVGKVDVPTGEVLYRGGKDFNGYLSTSKDVAGDYAKNRGGSVSEHILSPKAKVINYTDIPGVKYADVNDYNVGNYSKDRDILSFMNGDLEKDYSKAAKWAKQNGYDVVRFPTEGEVRVLNNKAISQPTAKQPAPQDIIDSINDALFSGDETTAQELHTALSEEFDLPSLKEMQAEISNIQNGIINEAQSVKVTDDATRVLKGIADKISKHFKAPGSLFKITGKERAYTAGGKTILVGGDAKSAMDRLFFATDIEGFKNTIDVLDKKFGGTFTEINELIKKGDIDGADYEEFKTIFGEALTNRPNYKSGRNSQVAKDSTNGKPRAKATSSKTAETAKVTKQVSPEAPELVKETNAVINNGRKERGMITSLKESDKVNQDLKEILYGEYSPKQNTELYTRAKQIVKENFNDAIEMAKTQISDEAVATGYVLIEDLMKKGDTKTAGEIAIRMAENATEAGRAIQAQKMLDRMTGAGLVTFIEKKIQKFNSDQRKKKLKGKPVEQLTDDQRKYFFDTAEAIQKMPEGIDKDVARFILLQEADDLFPSTMREKGANFWRAGLLTGTTTHLLNMTSTGMNLGAEQLTRIAAVPIDMILSMMTGQRSTSATFKGYGSGFKKGLGEAALYLKTGFDREHMTAKYDYKKVTYNTKAGKIAGKGAEYVYRLLGAEDKLFWNAAFQNSLYEQATIEAKNKGLKWGAKKEYVSQRVANPSNQLIDKASEQADIAAFHNKTKLGEAAKKLQGIWGGEYIVPFTNTPAAVAVQIAKYTPGTAVFTAADEIYKAITKKEFDQRRLATAIGRNVVGAVPFLIGSMLMGGKDDEEEWITLGYPMTDKQKQAQWELEGKKEYSIRIGDDWYQLQGFGPAGLVMGIGARYVQSRNAGNTPAQSMADAYISMINLVKSQSFLEGIDSLVKTTQYIDEASDVTGAGLRYVQGQATSWIPAIVGEVAQLLDPYEREARTFGEQVVSKLPFARNALSEKKDVLGNTIERRAGGWSFALNPFRPSKVRNADDIITAELGRLYNTGNKATPPRETNKLTIGKEKVKLSGAELSEFESVLGPKYKRYLFDLMNSPQYAALTDSQKKKMIDDVKEGIRKPETLRYVYEKNKVDDQTIANEVQDLNKSQKSYLNSGKLNLNMKMKKPEGNAPLGINSVFNSDNKNSFNLFESQGNKKEIIESLSELPDNDLAKQAMLMAIVGKTEGRKLLGLKKGKSGGKTVSKKIKKAKIAKIKYKKPKQIKFQKPKEIGYAKPKLGKAKTKKKINLTA